MRCAAAAALRRFICLVCGRGQRSGEGGEVGRQALGARAIVRQLWGEAARGALKEGDEEAERPRDFFRADREIEGGRDNG
jgi:hypothetical protein